MAMTKSRRIFPGLKVTASGQDFMAMYSFLLGCVVVDNHNWKSRNGRGVLEEKPNLQVPTCVNTCLNSLKFKGDLGKESCLLEQSQAHQTFIYTKEDRLCQTPSQL